MLDILKFFFNTLRKINFQNEYLFQIKKVNNNAINKHDISIFNNEAALEILYSHPIVSWNESVLQLFELQHFNEYIIFVVLLPHVQLAMHPEVVSYTPFVVIFPVFIK